MAFAQMIYKLRTDAGLSQEKLAEQLGLSRQAVQKWETGAAKPDLENALRIAGLFRVSLDALLLGRDLRIAEEMFRPVKPAYADQHQWDVYPYAENLDTEYTQCLEEGLDVRGYRDLFSAVRRMPADENRERAADVVYRIVRSANMLPDYAWQEPSGLEAIRALRPAGADHAPRAVDRSTLRSRVTGAWYGRICGCLLGKPVEGMRTDELVPLLKDTGNYPLCRYITAAEAAPFADRYEFKLHPGCCPDEIGCAPVDDDTNYTVLYQQLIEQCGRDFTPLDAAKLWLDRQSRNAYCTAERIAYCNFLKGYLPPDSAVYKNPFREWIGAQIRGDYFGYICPGDPEQAAGLAWRDASISHVKNGIYGEMFAAAMLACAAAVPTAEQAIEGGMAEIPAASRLYAALAGVLEGWRQGIPQTEAFARIHTEWDEHTSHGWCHTIPNACIVAAALLYGGQDYGRTVCMAVQTGFDTDCNGATAGSVLGMLLGQKAVGGEWRAPLHGVQDTTIFGVGRVPIAELVDTTLRHIDRAR